MDKLLGSRRSTFRSRRSVPPQGCMSTWTNKSVRRVAGFLLMCILACAVLPAVWLHQNALYDLTMTQPHSLGTVLSQSVQATQHHHRLKVNKQPPAQFEQDSDSEDEEDHSQEDSQDDEKSVGQEDSSEQDKSDKEEEQDSKDEDSQEDGSKEDGDDSQDTSSQGGGSKEEVDDSQASASKEEGLKEDEDASQESNTKESKDPEQDQSEEKEGDGGSESEDKNEENSDESDDESSHGDDYYENAGLAKKSEEDFDDDDDKQEKKSGLHVMNRNVALKHPKMPRKRPKHLDRGFSGLPMSETPALIGAKRGKVKKCDVNVDAMAYWNDPQGDFDVNFDRAASFHATGSTRYLTFEPDEGAWNNLRMSFENIFVFCAATGRTLVLPPPFPMYILDQGEKKDHGYSDFFPLNNLKMQKHCPIITMEEFIRKEGGIKTKNHVPLISMKKKSYKIAVEASKHCEMVATSSRSCQVLYAQLQKNGVTPELESYHSCFIFDEEALEHGKKTFVGDKLAQVERFCAGRDYMHYDKNLRDAPLVHFRSNAQEYRLLVHFYATIHFTDPVIDNHYKRLVRDFLHYRDSIFCAAGKIVLALQEEAIKRGFDVDEEGSGGFSALHIRRGDFQYKEVRLSAKRWYHNTKDIWLPNEILYIATDERDKSWFEPLAKHHDLRFLDDYWDFAGLGDLDPNYMGMIETVVASRGRAFAGTWFSTFTGYINRMRGYHGMGGKTSWYSFLPRKTKVHDWEYPSGNYFSHEYPIGWVGIDGNVVVEHEREYVPPKIS